MGLSMRTEHLYGQPMFQILSNARKIESAGKKLYHFELGDPGKNVGANIKRFVAESLLDGNTSYSPSKGEDYLLSAAQRVTELSRGFSPSKEQLLVTPGANMQIYLALACMCDLGDSVYVPVPYFPSYKAQILALGLKMVEVGTADNYKIASLHDLMEKPSPGSVLILNNPNNPSGIVYQHDELQSIYEDAVDLGMMIISDEVYSRQIYRNSFSSVSSFDKCKKRVVLVNSMSKSYAMTGFRIGVVAGPEKLIRRMEILLETICSCVPAFIQLGAAKILLSNQKIGHEYKERAAVMFDKLSYVSSLSCSLPDGGMYCWAKIKNGMTSQQYADYALGRGVVLSPGWIFGMDDHVRFSFATCNTEEIIEGIGLLI